MQKYVYKKYISEYKNFYISEKKKIAKALGSIAKIEHIGSTAILNLGGKGIIDIAVGVSKSKIIFIKKKLEKAGYEFREIASTPERLFFRHDYQYKNTARRIHIHLTKLNGKSWKEMIGFRDYLLCHPDTVKLYANIKKQGVKVAEGDGEKYRKYKEKFIKNIIKTVKKKSLKQTMNKTKKIAVFDSGVGGLTVLKKILKQLPNEEYIYYADTDHAPYGTKSKHEVKKYILEVVDFLLKQNIKALVIACNTATAILINDLRKKYKIPIIGMEPAVKPALEKNHLQKRIIVTGTLLTLQEKKLKTLLNNYDKKKLVDLLPLPELVGFAEKFQFEEKHIIDYLKNKFSKYDLSEYNTIVLGCTHFILFKKVFKKILPKHITLIDGNQGTVNNLIKILTEKKLINDNNKKKSIDLYLSGKRIVNLNIKKKYLALLK
jgi:glutamate racemase